MNRHDITTAFALPQPDFAQIFGRFRRLPRRKELPRFDHRAGSGKQLSSNLIDQLLSKVQWDGPITRGVLDPPPTDYIGRHLPDVGENLCLWPLLNTFQRGESLTEPAIEVP
jgi:hypothetical protein